MNALEDQLRAELLSESELIRHESIPELSLPGRSSRRAVMPRFRGRRRWPTWGTPLAAAAAVLAVVAGTLAAVSVLSPGPPRQPATGTARSTLPPYYAVTVSGSVVSYTIGGTQYGSSVLGRHIQLRSTATGKLVAVVSPPAPYNDFAVLTGTPDGRTFVFGAERYWGFRGAKSPFTGALDSNAPLSFVLLRITADGRAHWSTLSLPFKILPGQQPSIALSPDGTELAVVYGGGGQAAILRIVTLATGQVRQWQWPAVSWTPLIQGEGAWTADGRTLVLEQWNVIRGATGKPPATPADTASVRLIDTAVPGGGGEPGKLLTLRAPAGMSGPGAIFIIPDGSELVAPAGTGARNMRLGGEEAGEFAVYSTRTGALLRTMARWTWDSGDSRPARANAMPRPAVAWSDPSGGQLLVLLPHDGRNRLGVLTGSGFVLTGSGLLPNRPEAYAQLQSSVAGITAVPPSMTW